MINIKANNEYDITISINSIKFLYNIYYIKDLSLNVFIKYISSNINNEYYNKTGEWLNEFIINKIKKELKKFYLMLKLKEE